MLGKRLINTKVAGGGGCTDIVDNYDPFGGNGVALYQLNGNATDVSGNYDGTATNVTWGGTGVFGTSAAFNGSSSKISTSIATNNIGVDFNNRLSNFTFSAWFNTTALDSTDRRILSIGQGATTYKYIGFKKVNSEVRFEWYTGAAGGGVIHPISANTWYNIVGVREGGYLKLYINGSFIGQAEQTVDNSITSSATLTIGAHTVSTNYFNGSIDQVRIFNTALTPLEVEALYTEELCICDGTVDTLDILGDGSCIATYQLDGNANDLSGNYSGTPTDVSYGVGEFDLGAIANGTSTRINTGYIQNGQVFSVSFWGRNFSAYGSIIRDTPAAGGANTRINIVSNAAGGVALAGNYAVDPPTTGKTVWTHYVVTASGSVAKIYENTVEVASVSYSEAGGNNGTPVCMFSNGLYPAGFGEGELDQVRIFNKALSAGEVTTLYNETACTKPACTGTTNTLDILGDGSCIAAYPLDGSPADLSGNYNGVQTNVTYPQGEFDLAASFPNGTNSKIILPIAESFFSTNSQSVSLWVNMNSLASGVSQVGGYAFGQEGRWTIHIYQGSFSFLNFDSVNRTQEVSYNTSINLGQWYHIVAVKDKSSGMKIYVDNVLRDSNSYTTDIDTTSGVGMGYYESNSARDGFYGQIDQVRIFNKALSAGEVTTLYNETPCN